MNIVSFSGPIPRNMSARMEKNAYLVKEKWLDDLEEIYISKLRTFTTDVKASMQSTTRKSANDIFEIAFDILTQDFPDPKTRETEPADMSDEIAVLKKEVRTLKRSQNRLSKKLAEAKTRSDMFHWGTASGQDKNQSQASQTVALKSTGSLEPAVATPTASATPISVTVTNNQGMSPTPEASATSHDRTGKENQALSTKKGVSVKVDTATSSVSASLQKEPPQSLSFCTQFSAVSVKNTFQPLIYDFKLLPGGLLISADFRNYCVDLFNMQGKHLQRHVFVEKPRRLAVMDPDSEERWMVAVTLPVLSAVILLQIKPDSITQLNTIQMAYRCWAVAAVDDSTLAVGYEQREGITIMNISGCIIRQIGLNLIPYHMTATQDKCLLMSTRYNKITKIKVKDGTVIFDRAVPQIRDSSGNAALQNGWSVFSNCITNSVHLVTPNGHWARELWRQCSDQKFGAFLCTVCVDDGIYVTGFTNGTFCQLVDLT